MEMRNVVEFIELVKPLATRPDMAGLDKRHFMRFIRVTKNWADEQENDEAAAWQN